MTEPPPRATHGFGLRVEHRDDEGVVLVALDDAGVTVGLATGGASRDGDAGAAWELYSLHVAQPAQGTGLADDLLVGVLADRPASVWVLSANARARAFYSRHGFVADGATRAHEGSGAPELRMLRR